MSAMDDHDNARVCPSETGRLPCATKVMKIAGSLVMVIAVVGVVAYAQPQDPAAFMQKRDAAGRVLFTPEVVKNKDYGIFMNEVDDFDKVQGDGLEDKTSKICKIYGGIDHPNVKGCCNPSCGKYCGAVDCWDGDGGHKECCEGSFTKWCSATSGAPCLLNASKLEIVYEDKICKSHGGIDHPGKTACCPISCGEFCGGGENHGNSAYGGKCADAPFIGGAASCCARAMTTTCGPGVDAPCLLPVTTTAAVGPTTVQPITAIQYLMAFDASNPTAPRDIPGKFAPGDFVRMEPQFVGGHPSSFAVNPALPKGLFLDYRSGEVEGVLDEHLDVPMQTYVVTARNEMGEATDRISFAVATGRPHDLDFDGFSKEISTGKEVDWKPDVANGKGATYSVKPAFDNGLKLDSKTGDITGTPSKAEKAEYVVTAETEAGETTATLKFGVDVAPAGLDYACPKVLTTGDKVKLAPKLKSGEPSDFTVTPALPWGLRLDSKTGVIGGVPADGEKVAKETYVITAVGKSGKTTAECTFEVKVYVPKVKGCEYRHFPEKITPGSPISQAPTCSNGALSGFSIKPALPAGLTLDPATGLISGVAQPAKKCTKATKYTVFATNTVGKTTIDFEAAVLPEAPASLVISAQSVAFQGQHYAGHLGMPLAAAARLGAGLATSFSIKPDLPKGLTFDADTGKIFGTPEEADDKITEYKVTAEGCAGKASTEFKLAIAKAELTYAGDYYDAGDKVNLKPEIDGVAAAKFTVEPELPKELTLDAMTGDITGKLKKHKKPLPVYTVTAWEKHQDGKLRKVTDFDIVYFSPKPGGFPWWVIIVTLVIIGIIVALCMKPEPTAYKPMAVEEPKVVEVENAVRLLFGSPSGDKLITIDPAKTPLGIQYNASLPLKIKRDQPAASALGIQSGWELKAINGESITGMTNMQSINEKLQQEGIGCLEVALTWQTKDARGKITTYATMKPLGLRFPTELPLHITVEQEGHGKNIGVEVGFSLVNINGFEIKPNDPFEQVNQVLHKEVDKLPRMVNIRAVGT